MKIICIGRNYAAHAKELNNPVPDEQIIFLKPDTSLLKPGEDFYIPSFSNDIHYEAELVLKISKPGKHIEKKFCHKYFSQITIGIDFTARDLQSRLKEKGLPWENAKAFDGAAVIGEFIDLDIIGSKDQIGFTLYKNSNLVQKGNSADMIYKFEDIISHVSTFITLKQGDLIFTGTPVGVGKVDHEDFLEGYIGDKKLLSLKIK